MEVSLPDDKGLSSKIYLFNREKFYYYAKKEKYYLGINKDYNGEIAVIATKDGSHKIISGSKWSEGDYYQETNEFNPTEFNEYLLEWDENYIIIYANDIEIYKIDIKTLSDFKNYYYFLTFKNEETNNKYSGNAPEIRFKVLKVYQYINDTITGFSKFIYKVQNKYLVINYIYFLFLLNYL